jgi:hypothetical protein
MKKVILIFTFLLGLSGFVNAEEEYLCVGKQTTGFSYESGIWKQTNFHSGDKYLVKRYTIEDAKQFYSSYGITNAGMEKSLNFLKSEGYIGFFAFFSLDEQRWDPQLCDPKKSNVEKGNYWCHDFRFNTKTLKFIRMEDAHYTLFEDEPGPNLSPFITIGNCSMRP